MSASMTEHVSRRLMNHGISHVHKDATDDRYRDLRRPRKVRFFVNGDRFFKGKKLSITPQRYYNFNDLLNDLTGKLPSSLNLPYGVRQIFTPTRGRRVSDIEDLQDGETYVCAGFEGFKVIKYGRTELEPWSVGKHVKLSHLQEDAASSEGSYGGYKYRGYAANSFHPGRFYRANATQGTGAAVAQSNRKWPGTFGNTNTQQQRNPAGLLGGPTEAVPLKPRVITIVRNGPRPRINVKILLNRRSIQSFEQLMSDISEAFGAKWRNNRVQRLYSVRGKEVVGVSDFFREDDCFIALGNERLNDRDVADILSELYPDSAYGKMLLKEWDKQRRREKKAAAANKDSEVDKRDSGFVDGSEHGGGSNREQDSDALSTQRSHRQNQRGGGGGGGGGGGKRVSSERDSLVGSESGGSPQGYYALSKLERERRNAVRAEREKNKRRQSKLAEREKRAIDAGERKQRGLPPLNPLTPLDDIPRNRDPHKEKEEKSPRKKDNDREAQQPADKAEKEKEKDTEQAKKEKEERDQAEKAARARMAAAEKAEKEKQEKEAKEREKAEKERADRGKAEKEKAEKEAKAESEEKDEKTKTEKAAQPAKTPTTTTTTTDKESEKQQQDKPQDLTEDKDGKPEKKRKKDNNNNNNNNNKDKDNAGGGDSHTGRKAKAKVVRRSKVERQISSDSFITERYELGRTLGDGNFAIVRFSRQKSSSQEFAMKVIDKPKLRGKEHMVENEIEIMKDCSHPNIVKLYEEYETRDKIYLVMELVKGGDLFDAITQSVKFGEVDSFSMVKDMCNALYYLHSRSIVHRDLKPENLLVHRNKDGTITLKLADFGLAMEVKENIFTVCGTPTYVAPEILTEIGYGLEVDMWAVGVITYILLCGFPPFRSPDRNQTELFEFIKAGEYEFLSPYWDNVSDSAKDLIRRLLVVKKSKRYTAVDVLSHPWVVCGGDTSRPLPGIASLSSYCKEIRHDLQDQAKRNYDNYQKAKERHREE
ncbi:serine/threonine-protein kinase DCLK3-like [Babylonia areolata]|uniref:serine/threonine-protein kinase DCLK3-like n=1 Tax=Babylonia areolata TaxID=304850 RepID=UPI003FD6661F